VVIDYAIGEIRLYINSVRGDEIFALPTTGTITAAIALVVGTAGLLVLLLPIAIYMDLRDYRAERDPSPAERDAVAFEFIRRFGWLAPATLRFTRRLGLWKFSYTLHTPYHGAVSTFRRFFVIFRHELLYKVFFFSPPL
jgi:hypothetical protein